MKKIVVNDTNVFIDLLNIGLLEEFFSLPWEVYTTNFVMLELLREGQQEAVSLYKEKGRLHIPKLESLEMAEIVGLFHRHMNRTNLSLTDCSVWYYAWVNNYVLLTGDRKLRLASEYEGVEVHGIIYVFDSLIESGIITCEVAIEKLKQLYRSNPRLPQEELDKRLKLWEVSSEDEGGGL